MTCFGLKYSQDLENRAAHPHQEFTGYLQAQPRPQDFSLKNGWGGKRPRHRLVTCLLAHPKILGVINLRLLKSYNYA